MLHKGLHVSSPTGSSSGATRRYMRGRGGLCTVAHAKHAPTAPQPRTPCRKAPHALPGYVVGTATLPKACKALSPPRGLLYRGVMRFMPYAHTLCVRLRRRASHSGVTLKHVSRIPRYASRVSPLQASRWKRTESGEPIQRRTGQGLPPSVRHHRRGAATPHPIASARWNSAPERQDAPASCSRIMRAGSITRATPRDPHAIRMPLLTPFASTTLCDSRCACQAPRCLVCACASVTRVTRMPCASPVAGARAARRAPSRPGGRIP